MATSKSDLIKQIKRYKNYVESVDPPESDEARILHYIKKLAKLPVTYEVLEATEIGRTINRLRKREGIYKADANLLVTKWKDIATEHVKAEEHQMKKKETRKESQSNSSGKKKSVNDDEQQNSKEENDPQFEQKSETKTTHLITLKNRQKRKHSEQLEDEKRIKYAKVHEKDWMESGVSVAKNNGVDVSPDKAEFSFLDDVDRNFEKSKNGHSHEERKHKKSHEKRHKSSKHSDENDRHHSKTSRQDEKVAVEENGESSRKKHRSKDSKTSSKSDSKKEDRKHESRKRSASTRELKIVEKESKQTDEADDHVDSTTGDDFGAVLLNIPHTASPKPKKRSTSSKASTNQDSVPSPSSQKSLTNFDMFSTVQLEPLDFADDFKDTDFYLSPNSNVQTKTTPRTVTDEEMLNSMIVTKNQKTKVYSGNKSGINNVPSLFGICSRVLQDNFDALEYTGGVPFNILKSILEKVSAQQLYTFENYNPYLIGETDDLWKYHASREFRNAERLEYESWRDLFLRCFEEREVRLQALTKNITQTMANSAPVRKTQLAYLDSTVKPPRNVARSQAKNGTGSTSSSLSAKRSPPNATQSLKERLAKDVMGPNAIQVPSKSLAARKKKAPLMQKSLQLMKGLKR